jgi:cytochrome b involved in lipid metabolism
MAPRADDPTATTPVVHSSTAEAADTATSGKQRVISLSEVAKHNNRQDAWLVVHGRVVDVTQFAKRHPGGDIILLGAGLDATILFESYHVRRVDLAMLNKYQIGVLDTSVSQEVANGESAASSYYNWDSEFYPTMQKRVVERLDKLGYQRRGGLL